MHKLYTSLLFLGLSLSPVFNVWADDLDTAYRYYLQGKYNRALEVIVPHAQAGNAKAQFLLGYIAEKGDSSHDPDIELAAQWYTASSEQNYPDAQYALASIYRKWWHESRRPIRAASLSYLAIIDNDPYLTQSKSLYQRAYDNNHSKAGEALLNLEDELSRYKSSIVNTFAKPNNETVIHVPPIPNANNERAERDPDSSLYESKNQSNKKTKPSTAIDYTNFSLIPGRARIWSPGEMSRRGTINQRDGSVTVYDYVDEITWVTYQVSVLHFSDKSMAKLSGDAATSATRGFLLGKLITMNSMYQQELGEDFEYSVSYIDPIIFQGKHGIEYEIVFRGLTRHVDLRGYSVYLPEGIIISMQTQSISGISKFSESTHRKFNLSLRIY